MHRTALVAFALVASLATASTAAACAMLKRPMPRAVVAQMELDKGKLAEQRGADRQAIRHYERAMNGKGKATVRATAALRAGKLHADAGQADRARERFARAVALLPASPSPRLALGAHLLGTDDAQAVKHLETAVDLGLEADREALARLALAKGLIRLGRAGEARAALERAETLGAPADAIAAARAQLRQNAAAAM